MGLQQKKKYSYILGEPLYLKLTDSATQEKHILERSNSDSLAVSPPCNQNFDDLYQRWLSLSPRDQDVIALTCLGYTNRQIAFRLSISVGTVKSYIQNVFHKLDLHSKTDLRLTFYGWDFSAWK
jgi:DNA-binding NarL/FixJ family response regulator